MRIINAMFGYKKSSIEQVFLAYGASLANHGNEVVALVHPSATILPTLIQSDMMMETVANYGNWDVAAVWRLKQIIRRIDPDCIIAHGNRAVILLRRASVGIPIIGVCHNYNLKHLLGCDALISISEDIRTMLISRGQTEATIYKIPNMITIPEGLTTRPSLSFRDPPVIGAMGKFVKNKGLDIFIKSLALLKAKEIPFSALIGGNGSEDEELRKLVITLGLKGDVTFTGWVEDKEHFYKSCDIFCLSSLYEPFSTGLLEAFLYALPVVTSDSEGPREIARNEIDALVIPKGNAEAMASAIERLIADRKLAAKLAINGFKTVSNSYNSTIVGEQLHETVETIVNGWDRAINESVFSG